MDKGTIIEEIGKIIDEVQTALLATVDKDGKPAVRWVTPALIKGRSEALYTITDARSKKAEHLKLNPNVQWMFQTRALDRIITVDGKVNIVDNPSFRSEVLEVVGNKLRAFWKIDVAERDLVVLETIIDRATYYIPMKGKKETVSF